MTLHQEMGKVQVSPGSNFPGFIIAGGQGSNMSLETIICLALAVMMVVGGTVAGYFFFSDSPKLGPGTPAEIAIAEKWIRMLLTVLWLGFAFFAVLLMILVSAGIEIASNFLARRKLGLKQNSGHFSTHSGPTAGP